MKTIGRKNKLLLLLLAGLWPLSALPLRAGTLVFSKPQKLVTLPWSNGSNHGVPLTGAEWLLLDKGGRFILESNLDFDFYSPKGKYLKTLNPVDKSKNFYGFAGMEPFPDGGLLLLQRLESSLEQRNKDNFEEKARPGSRLLILDQEGKVLMDKELVDPRQPHSGYYVENAFVFSVHDDGRYETLESVDSHSSLDPAFGNFATVANSLEKWLEHLKSLPVFHSSNRIYHDTKGNVHEIKGAVTTLMGRNFVEGVGPLAIRDGKVYFQAVCDKNQDFINVVFVEDSKRKDYGLVELFRADEDLDRTHGHALFVDQKGNLYEGVAKKDGYQIYEWNLIR